MEISFHVCRTFAKSHWNTYEKSRATNCVVVSRALMLVSSPIPPNKTISAIHFTQKVAMKWCSQAPRSWRAGAPAHFCRYAVLKAQMAF